MKNFEKKYQLWTLGDYAYAFSEFDTLQECIEAPKYSDWYITKRVQIRVTDVDELVSTLKEIPPNTYGKTIPPAETRSDEEEPSEALDAYIRGSVGELSSS